VRKDVVVHRQLGCWLRSSHSFKECVTAHQSSVAAPIMYRDSSTLPKLRAFLSFTGEGSGRGAFCSRMKRQPRGAFDEAEVIMPE
jgi:hypothetical protein